ncbi:MAG: DEAD/DEAH box helicase [Hyphomicrobium sp.]
MTFPSTHPALARALAARDYSVPTAVQLAVLDAHAAARDLLVSAQTGSGKTVAFGMAIAVPLLGEAERFERGAEPLALIIAPTRELAMQVQRELDWLYKDTGARVVTCVGGMDARAEARLLSQGAHIVVGTPGRLRDHLERRRLDLSKLRSIVLDEADEMLDLGFREDLEFILDATPESRQTLLFSATMPREIEMLARRYQRDAIRIETIRRDEQHADIEYRAVAVAPHDIENAVVNVLRLHETRATLVFCSTREAVKRMQARLLERGFSAVALSGELTQHERTQALQALRDGRARVLVATDVAARGLDLPDLALVIHADLPNNRETLLHRSGRTGRAGRKGLVTLIVPFNRRRKADILLSAAKVTATWGPAPTAEEIRARDQERFLADEIFTLVSSEEESVLVRNLQAARTAGEIALALVRIHSARLPAPEDLAIDAGPPRRADRVRDDRPRREPFERRPHRERDEAPSSGVAGHADFAPRTPRPRREDNREMVWFKLNIGRDRNADPRWLVPLICKAGNITKAEIGTIKINDLDTRFQIVATVAGDFAYAVRTSKSKEGHISRVSVHSSADDAAVEEAINALAVAESGAVRTVHRAEPAQTEVKEKAPLRARPKAPWHERKKPEAGGYQARNKSGDRDFSGKGFGGKDLWSKSSGSKSSGSKSSGSRSFESKSSGPKSDGPRDFGVKTSAKRPMPDGAVQPAPRANNGPRIESRGPKPASKYAHKKKNRPPVPATS